jgi:hypothetical protein
MRTLEISPIGRVRALPDRWRWVVPALGFAVLALAIALYRLDPPVYFDVLTAMMMRPYPVPLIDAAQIPTLVECWRNGADVFVDASCDPLNRVLAYSPLFLWLFYPMSGPGWATGFGLALDAAFLLSLTLLPPPRRWLEVMLLAVATFSSLPAFALERANMDVAMFVLIAVGGWCCWRGPIARLFGYAALTLAGLLKFYPLVLFLLFLRERLSLFLALSLAAAGILAGFLWLFHAELAEMVRNLPTTSYFTDGFGVRQLPFGLGFVLQSLSAELGLDDTALVRSLGLPINAILIVDVFVLMIFLSLGIGIQLATRRAFRRAFADLTAEQRGFLVAAAVLFCGCFFAGQNLSYRGIHFIFAVPGIVALATSPVSGAIRRVFRVTLAAMLLVLWGLTLQQVVAGLSGATDSPMQGSIAIDLYWIVHELAWWWLIAVFLGVLFCFVGQSPVWPALLRIRRPA